MVQSKKTHVGENIKTLRKLAGMNQAELADKIGKTRGLVSTIEKRGKVNYYTLKDIATALDTSVEFIENYEKGQVVIHKSLLSDKQDEYITLNISTLLREIELLKQVIEQQRKIIELMESEQSDSKTKRSRKQN
jgi:transcriptional regulator with XRE-family HTH domain